MFKVNNKNTRTDVTDEVLLFLLLTGTYFTPISGVSIVEFEQVNFSWEIHFKVACVVQIKLFYYGLILL